MFLTPDDLKALTGSPRRSRQIAWLTREGWRFQVDYNGRPVVAQAEVDAKMVSNAPQKASKLNWSKVA